MRTEEIVVGGRYVFWSGHVQVVGRVIEIDAEDTTQAPLVLMREEVTGRLFTRRGGHLLARLGEPIWNIRWPQSRPLPKDCQTCGGTGWKPVLEPMGPFLQEVKGIKELCDCQKKASNPGLSRPLGGSERAT